MTKCILLSYFLIFITTSSFSQIKYACFENDINKKLRISVGFSENEKARFVKYYGQKDSIPIFYSKIIKVANDNSGGIPAFYWEKIYIEKLNGKVTGKYSFTNAGPYQLDVYYTRKKDNRKFYFTIIEELKGTLEIPFQTNPCF